MVLLIQPDEEMQVKIREALNENVSSRQSDLEIIKQWLKQQPHLPDAWDEQCILTFLRGCKFSLEKTKRKLDMYFTMRTALPEFFANRDVNNKELRELVDLGAIPPLPGLTPEGRRVVILRGNDSNIPTPDLSIAIKGLFMIGDIRLKEETTGVAGDVYILDASVATAKHFANVSPSYIKKFLVCVQEAYPVKLKEVHVINVSPLIDTIVNFVKPFLKEKVKSRIFIHSTLESLYKHVPQDMLPDEYGGKAGKIMDLHYAWVKKLEEYGPWFKEQESLKADESKRPGEPTNYDDLFGLDGSFRQLTID